MNKIFVLAALFVLAERAYAGGRAARPVHNVHARVIKDFSLRYDEVSDLKWLLNEKGSTMYFTKDGFHDKAVYDLGGRWKYTILYYNEAKLPRDIRAVVKRDYFDLDIKAIEEIHTHDGKAYFVHLEDETTLKLVKVTTDGEMETIEDLQKG